MGGLGKGWIGRCLDAGAWMERGLDWEGLGLGGAWIGRGLDWEGLVLGGAWMGVSTVPLVPFSGSAFRLAYHRHRADQK